ncbi:CcoQ/FixQ family Cbb3-type cytochrome c oxidase assembly chaperone [Pseudomonas sp. KK4]|uniref:cbb3-type cytochrome oxidase subunit 3 n=1 Tax=Pseudomonas sp. KK4 TaxID=1855729 RepID=UPI00097C72AC|nr:CcoQ/FixQ family Cbb3-type cytochrome c oxidase assembly chaperone [Pseudomonas sp. KK4]
MVVEMSTGMIRGLGTVVVFVAFVGLSLWVFSGQRRQAFAEARLLPFADEPQPDISEETRSTRP